MGRGIRLAIVLTWLALAGVLAHCSNAAEPNNDGVPLPDRAPSAEGGEDARTVDAALLACDALKPFGAPTLVAGLDTTKFFATPRLSKDELSIYFTTLVGDAAALQAKLERATRPSRDAAFGPGTLIAALNSAQNDNDPMVGTDDRSLWFSSSRSGQNEIYVARRASTSVDFGPPALVPGLAGQNAHPYYRLEGPELWFTSDRSDGGADIYVATSRDGSFDPPRLVTELSTKAADVQPALTTDGLGVILASTREGGAGGFDLWIARRDTTSEPFRAPTSLSEVNTAADEYAGWISPDGCRVYFSSSRGTDASPRHRLWYAERAKP